MTGAPRGCLPLTRPLLPAGVSFNSVYTQIWRVLLHLAADPYPDVCDLAMKVLNSIAYKVRTPPRPGAPRPRGSRGQPPPRSDTAAVCQGRIPRCCLPCWGAR